MASQITNHTEQALARLCEQFKGQPNIVKLLTALTGTVQDVETALWQILTERSVDNATGVHLDAIGAVVGQDRGGLIDEDYRRFIRARIATNRSRGTIGDILRISRLVLNDPAAYLELDNQGAAAYVLRVNDVVITDDLAEILIDFLRAAVAANATRTGATSAGVRVILEYSAAEDRAIWGTSTYESTDVWARALD